MTFGLKVHRNAESISKISYIIITCKITYIEQFSLTVFAVQNGSDIQYFRMALSGPACSNHVAVIR